MLEFRLIRSNPKDINVNYTCGEMFYRENETELWQDLCFTLEDKTRDINKSGDFDNEEKKVYGQTSIPFGKYDGELTYSPKFKTELPLIKNVPKFEGIRIHAGNTIKDTEGCILVGMGTNWKGNIYESRKALSKVLDLIKNNGNKFTLEII